MKRILILSIWDNIWSLGEGCGVAEEIEFIKYFTSRGIELHFMIPAPAEKQETLDDGLLSYHYYPNIFRSFEHLPAIAKRFLWLTLFPLVTVRRLRRLAAELGPDLLMGFTHYTLHPMHRVGKELGIPAVAKLFGVMYLDRFEFPKLKYLWKSFDQLIALRSTVDHYIVLNDGTRGKMALTRLGVPGAKISFLLNGMDMSWADLDVNRDEARKALGLPREDKLVVTFSRLVKSKRIELFLRAASLIDRRLMENVTLVVGGDGPERGKLEREAREFGLGGKVAFTGVLPYREIPCLLKACDIFVGTNELTNMSMPPCEAILCGVPVVAFDVSGTSEMIRDGETGLLVPDGDIGGLAEKIGLLLEDEGLRSELGRRAAEFARDHFVSWDERLGNELDTLEGLLKSEPPG